MPARTRQQQRNQQIEETLQEKGADALFEAGVRLLVDGAEAGLTIDNNHGRQS